MKHEKVKIRKLATGVPGLDEIFGGGLPEYSFNIIGGTPGSGKTTLAHQIAFANITPDKPAVYFTILGEPAFKMLRHQQQYNFFDLSKLNKEIHFVNLSELAAKRDLNAILAEMKKQVNAIGPSIVIVDSFRTVMWTATSDEAIREHQTFIHQLSMHLASWQATTFLIGEYTDADIQNNPAFTVADGLFWLSQKVHHNSMVRQMQVMKLRGQASLPGLHTFRITDDGLQAFPRTLDVAHKGRTKVSPRRLSTGLPRLDIMMGGGIREQDCTLVVGPAGGGKSLLGMHFVNEGYRAKEAAIVVNFEEFPAVYLDRASLLGMNLSAAQDEGLLKVLYLRPLDLSVDEAIAEIASAIKKIDAKRVVIDSLSGFELAVAPPFRADFRESIYRMIGALTRLGVTIILTLEVQEEFTSFALSPFTISILSDNVIRLRYVEIKGELKKMMVVLKMRSSDHSNKIYQYNITDSGINVQDSFEDYMGLISGVPRPLKDISHGTQLSEKE